MSKRRVMVVGQEPAERSAIAELVEQEGYESLQADGAVRALRLASENQFAAILLDINLPGTDGTSLCWMIRHIPGYNLVPIIFIADKDRNLAEAFKAGCDDLINTPIDPLVLRARLNGNIQRTEYFQQLERTRRMLDNYLSRRTREVVEIAAKTGRLPSPEQREVVILFTDIRGFTALSEEIEPNQLFELLSAQLAMQVDMVHEFGGYVDKFGGDGLMAVFDGGDNMAAQSCLCALAIMAAAAGTTDDDRRVSQLGIGIHMGRVVIGNIGSPEHLDYSVIGNAVNLAARLCGHASSNSTVISKTVRDAAINDPRLHFEAERQVMIRGLREAVTVYTLSPA